MGATPAVAPEHGSSRPRAARYAAGTAILALAFLAACTDAPVPACEPLVEGVRVVANPAPTAGARTFRLVELWRRAGTREGEELSLPIGVAASPDGRVAIPDFRLAEVSVVEADGTWSGPVTRQGEGPGETRIPVAAVWDAHAELLIFDLGNSRIVAVDTMGQPVRDDVLLDPAFAAPVITRGELLGVGLQRPGAPFLITRAEVTQPGGAFGDRMRAVVLRLDPGSARIDTLAAPEYPLAFVPGWGGVAVPGWPRPIAAAAGATLAVAADDGSYRILVRDSTAAPVLQVCRQTEPVPLGARELGGPGDTAQAALAQAFAAADGPTWPASIGRIVVTVEGGLWVQRERPAVLGGSNEMLWGVAGAAMDVFDQAGRFQGIVEVPAGARIQAVSSDRAWAFEVGPLDEVWLVAYRVVAD